MMGARTECTAGPKGGHSPAVRTVDREEWPTNGKGRDARGRSDTRGAIGGFVPAMGKGET